MQPVRTVIGKRIEVECGPLKIKCPPGELPTRCGLLMQDLLAERAASHELRQRAKSAARRVVLLIRNSTQGSLTTEQYAELQALQAELEQHLSQWDDRLLKEVAELEKTVREGSDDE
jgi:hypothetical protein